jgi:hypothetical protein
MTYWITSSTRSAGSSGHRARDSRRGSGASSTELEARSREIEHLKAELAGVVK